MKYDKFKKGIMSLTLMGSFLLGGSFVQSALAMNSPEHNPTAVKGTNLELRQDRRYRYWRHEREARRRERARMMRYRAHRNGYYDRWGRFHRY